MKNSARAFCRREVAKIYTPRYALAGGIPVDARTLAEEFGRESRSVRKFAKMKSGKKAAGKVSKPTPKVNPKSQPKLMSEAELESTFGGAKNPSFSKCNNISKTGTVWDNIQATQPKMEGSCIPKSFEIQANEHKYWVAPNGTKHMYEYSTRSLKASPTDFSVSATQKMIEQELLDSFRSAICEAEKIGYKFEIPIKIANWELIFSPAREKGLCTVVKHAVYMK